MTCRAFKAKLTHPIFDVGTMALTVEQQTTELITRAKRILVATKEHASVDALAAVVALLTYLRKLDKQADGVVPGFTPDQLPKFLGTADGIRPLAGAMRAFELALDVTKTPMEEITYDVRNGKLLVHIVPETGEWTPADVSFRHGEDRYDLVIALDCPDRISLGPLFRDHADFLYRTPVINIDRDPGNEHWGQVNLVDLTAVSTSEILYGLFQRWDKHQIDESIATALLAGMIAKTQSFRTQSVTPKTLQHASALVAMGAKREEIVHGLWRTRSVATLRLWGKALSRLEQDRELGIVWATLSRQDFVDTGAHENALEGVVDELLSYAPEAKVVVLVHEQEGNGGACVTIHAASSRNAQELGRPFGATGSRERVDFCLTPGQPLIEGTQMVIDRLRQTIQATK